MPFCPESGEDSADLPAPAPSPPAAASGTQGSVAAPAKVRLGVVPLLWWPGQSTVACVQDWPWCRGNEHFNLETKLPAGPLQSQRRGAPAARLLTAVALSVPASPKAVREVPRGAAPVPAGAEASAV